MYICCTLRFTEAINVNVQLLGTQKQENSQLASQCPGKVVVNGKGRLKLLSCVYNILYKLTSTIED